MTFNDHWNKVKHKYTGTDYYRADELAADIWQASRQAAFEECLSICEANKLKEGWLIAELIRAAKGGGDEQIRMDRS